VISTHVTFVLDLNPEEYVSIPGGMAIFSCFVQSLDHINWLINGTDSGNFSNAVAQYESNTGVMIGLGELRLSNLSINFDMTVIKCVTSSGGADSSVLRVQGLGAPGGKSN
jgi:hypothetical protein